jgi:hypothetical protein
MKSHFKLRTTINLNAEKLVLWKYQCEQHNISFNYLIKIAVKQYLQDSKKLKDSWHTISYQEKGVDYSKVHFSMKGFEYDFYLDAKKFLRCSFTLIVAEALEKYAQLIFMGELVDSYPLQGYTKIHICKNNYSFYVICSGIPAQPMTLEIFHE